MKKVMYVVMLSLLMIGCGRGDAQAVDLNKELTKEQIEEKFNLPPEPDESHPDYHTLRGVDSNNNMIRDDVERFIAFESYKEPFMVDALNVVAKQGYARNKAYEDNDKELYRMYDDSIYARSCYMDLTETPEKNLMRRS